MLNSFEISKNAGDKYGNTFSLTENILFGYTHKDLFNIVEQDGKSIGCYGYCFDVREPKTSVSETLNDLLNDYKNLEENLKYLNGHYVLVFNLNDSWSLVTDTVSMTPVYYDVENHIVIAEDNTELPSTSF